MPKTSHRFGLIIIGILLHGMTNVILAGDSITLKDVDFTENKNFTHEKTMKRDICVDITKQLGNHSHSIDIVSNRHADKGQFYLESQYGNKIFYTIEFIDHKVGKKFNVQSNNHYALVYRCSPIIQKSELSFTITVASLTPSPAAGTYTDTLTVTLHSPDDSSNG